MKEKWCCFGLENAFSKREERGIFVFATPPDEGEIKPSFWLGMRSVNKKDQLDFSKYLNEKCEKIDKTIDITISTRTPIKYCPWCGKNLVIKYLKSFKMLIDESIADEFKIR